MTAAQMMAQARALLVLDHPFFGALALRLKLVEDPSRPTAWTDGSRIGYNPKFVEKLTLEQRIGLICHEVMHVASGHPWRRDLREPRKANIAMDYAINYIIEEAGLKLPEGRLRDAQWDGKSFEWIYARLPEPPQQDGPGGPGTGMPGAGGEDVCDAGSEGDQADGCSEAEWQQAVYQAAAAAKARGTLPASLDRFAKMAAKPKVDWRSVLHRFVQQSAKDDYSWRRPNTRYLAGGFYLPCLRSEAAGPMAVAIDTSGSIDDITLAQFLAELQSVADDVKPERVYVIYCDAAIGRVDTFERGEQIELHPCGGGGTSHVPVMNYVDAMEEPPACLVCLTDMYTAFRPEPPVCPVLWATISEVDTAPYGEVVEVK